MSATSAVTPMIITHNDKTYYSSKYLQDAFPHFFFGCQSRPRQIVQRKEIPDTEYIFANKTAKTNQWNRSTNSCRKAQLLISKEWTDAYLIRATKPLLNNSPSPPSLSPSPPLSPPPAPSLSPSPPPSLSPPVVDVGEPAVDAENENNEHVEYLPALVCLEDHEKFKDVDGTVFEIQAVGAKTRKGIYFRVKDVMTAFQLSYLNDTLIKKQTHFSKQTHYVDFFILPESNIVRTAAIKKERYLTYKGLLRVLFASSSGNAERFQDWAEEKLFAIQLGTRDDKLKVGTELLGVTVQDFKAVFDTHASKFPAIYLISLGKVAALRETFGISPDVDDECTVYKYGFTDNLERRIGEHQSKYGKLANVSIKLSIFHIVDVKYTSAAESEVRDFFRIFDRHLCVEKYNELVAFPSRQHKQIVRQFKFIGDSYIGNSASFQSEIQSLKQKIAEMEHANEIKDLVHRNEKRELQHANELMEQARDMAEKELGLIKLNFELRLQLLQQ